jgi:hypothetical protein
VGAANIATATAATTDKPKPSRAPKTSADVPAGPPANLGADVVNLLTRILEGQDKLGTTVSGIIEEAASKKSTRTDTLEKGYATLASEVSALRTELANIGHFCIWSLLIQLDAQAQALNVSSIDILQTAMKGESDLGALMQTARGKD